MPEDPSTEAVPPAPKASPEPGRDRSLDVAKGLAILAIVVSHVLRGLAAADDVNRTSTAFLEVDDALYSWHVAVFALVAGVFLPRGVEKRGTAAYLRPRLILFAWLYVVWTVVQAGEKLLEGVVGDGPADVGAFFLSFVIAYGQLWWLGFMVLASLAGAFVQPWVSRRRAVLSSLAVLAVSLLAWGWTGPWLFLEGIALLAFFWAGMLAGRGGTASVTTSRATVWVAAVGLVVGSVLLVLADPMPPSSWLGARTLPALGLGVVTAVSLCAGVLALSGLLARTRLVTPLALVGERSLEIFLGHIIAIAAALGLLEALGLEAFALQVVAGTVAGVVLPLGLWELGRRVGFPWLFASPWR